MPTLRRRRYPIEEVADLQDRGRERTDRPTGMPPSSGRSSMPWRSMVAVTALFAWQVPFLGMPGAFDRDELEKLAKDFLTETVSSVVPSPPGSLVDGGG